MNFVLYKGKVVQPKAIKEDKLRRLQLDARRVLGDAMARDGSYLGPPPEGSDTWRWAQRVLSVRHPAVCVGIGEYANLSELHPVPPLPPRHYFSHSTWLPPRNEIELLPVWKHFDGRELRIIRMHSPTTAFVVEMKYGGLWTSKVHIDDLQPMRDEFPT